MLEKVLFGLFWKKTGSKKSKSGTGKKPDFFLVFNTQKNGTNNTVLI